VNQLFQTLQSKRVPARLLRIEVTEAVLLSNIATAERALRGLRGLGVDLVLDNFGGDHGALGLVNRFAMKTVKIDRSVIAGLHKPENHAFVQGVVAMASTLDLAVTAEGVETEDQRGAVAQLGCRRAQGFFFGKPVDAVQLAERAVTAVT
jgi:EAL domain-containing protein (putative c-di-GMP-specific phosphodiesterase class I)